jgi:hypothetical protein
MRLEINHMCKPLKFIQETEGKTNNDIEECRLESCKRYALQQNGESLPKQVKETGRSPNPNSRSQKRRVPQLRPPKKRALSEWPLDTGLTGVLTATWHSHGKACVP